MLMTAFNEIHPGLTVIELPSNEAEVAGPISPDLKVVKVAAAISSYDRAMIYKGKVIEGSLIGIPIKWLEDVEAKYDVHYLISQISIDLIPFNLPSRESSPMVHSKLQAFLQHSSREVNVGVALYILGLGVSAIEKRVEGVGAALRNLIDLAVIQMLGRILRLPYGRCLGCPSRIRYSMSSSWTISPRRQRSSKRSLSGRS